jgi:hypothetical protein
MESLNNKSDLVLLVLKQQLKRDIDTCKSNIANFKYGDITKYEIYDEISNDIKLIEEMEEEELEEILIKRL